jgi:DhnA family fructose-bisphosphate aldolase class Ia
LLDPGEALDLGASGLVIYFLLGYEEQIEAACLRATVQMALQGSQAGLPLIVDVVPTGPRVMLRGKAIELGVSYALEGGTDGVAVPWPGRESFERILSMAAGSPVWVKPANFEAAVAELDEALEMGAAGPWLDERLFAQADPVASLEILRAQVHNSEPQSTRRTLR